jgi:hypothetical protein
MELKLLEVDERAVNGSPYLGMMLRRARARVVTKTPEDASDPLVLPLGKGFAA